jgi:hypothetical protein
MQQNVYLSVKVCNESSPQKVVNKNDHLSGKDKEAITSNMPSNTPKDEDYEDDFIEGSTENINESLVSKTIHIHVSPNGTISVNSHKYI